MAEKISDADIRSELLALGEKSIGPITDTTRPLYLKKLTRLKTENKKTKFSERPKTPRKALTALSSDDSDDEIKTSVATRSSRSFTRTVKVSPKRSPVKKASLSKTKTSQSNRNGHYSSFVINGYDDTNEEDDEDNDMPSMRSTGLQASFNSTLNRTGFDEGYLKPTVKDTKNEFSDSDQEDFKPSQVLGKPLSWTSKASSLNDSSVARNRFSQSKKGPFSARYSDFLEPNRPFSSKLHRSFVDQTGTMGTDGLRKKESSSLYSISNYVSFALIIVALVFFCALAFMYINMQWLEDAREQESTAMICEQTNPSPDCHKKEKVKNALKVAKEISSLLMDQAGRYECHGDKMRDVPVMSLESAVSKKLGVNVKRGDDSDFDLALELFIKNKNWNVRLYDNGKEEVTSTADVKFLEAVEANMGLLCRISRAVQRMFRSLILFSCVIFTSLLVIWYVRRRWRKQKEEQRLIFSIVEKIIHILKEHNEACQTNKDLQPYLAIPHVRDQLIPMRERKRMQHVWEKAVKFLSENESRVREEVQHIENEEFPVWRWIQANTNGVKCWQGQAFGEGNETTVSKLSFIPPPCLKIRNMFNLEMEYEPDWHVKIQDAILEKCGTSHGIVHISVDKTSKEGCVYVKCNSSEAAEQAFMTLHGSWFDSRLVTVKFIRLERYHERFPEAARSTGLLKPSNNERTSLSQPFHRSFLEKC